MQELLKLKNVLEMQIDLIESKSTMNELDVVRIDSYSHIQGIIDFELNNLLKELEQEFGTKK